MKNGLKLAENDKIFVLLKFPVSHPIFINFPPLFGWKLGRIYSPDVQ